MSRSDIISPKMKRNIKMMDFKDGKHEKTIIKTALIGLFKTDFIGMKKAWDLTAQTVWREKLQAAAKGWFFNCEFLAEIRMYWGLIKFADVFKVRVLAEIYRKFSKICSVNFKTAI